VNARLAVLLVAVPLALSCTSGAGRSGRLATPRHDANIISAEELAGVNASNLYDAIRLLRTEWLRRSAPTTLLPGAEYAVAVYLDRVRFGDLESLRQLPVSSAVRVRYYSASEAQSEFGVSNLQGAIQVVTVRAR
jgi:hypothetical protein